ncbi:MBL fold metallo-hydrolase [Synechococcus sp. CBW1004]|uniref:MBL fold metallo-hydrolase n=1 Tax=Synechococcus sp. CBW1004 TaxID=1353136 RepID=UPI0018CF5859|nr:MBL fold metallo-hydrolase [Synechococcus sp. CBW1004]QPN64040.1 MBL fold metallo-hydrolase [Synechococcus sp. CBW1004]
MNKPFAIRVKFDLLKVGHCQHPECMALRSGGRRAIDFPALVGLIEHPQRGLMLYDTGYSRHFHEATKRFPECLYRMITPVTLPPPEEELLAQLESRGIRASDIETIIISHFHADHVAGLRDFPKASFIATRSEHTLCKQKNRLGRLRRAYMRELLPQDMEKRLQYAEMMPLIPLPDAWKPFEAMHDLLHDGSLLGVDLPGHTASQLGLAFYADKPIFLIGDSCWKIEGLIRGKKPSPLAYLVFDDGEAYDATFAKLRALYLSPHAPLVIPSHCTTTWRQYGGSRRIQRG